MAEETGKTVAILDQFQPVSQRVGTTVKCGYRCRDCGKDFWTNGKLPADHECKPPVADDKAAKPGENGKAS